MGKNGFLEKRRIERQAYFDAGFQMGRQQILDMMCLTLNDQKVMGKDTFGERRLLKIIFDIGKKIDIFQKAWEMDDETDYYRAKLDEMLKKALKKPLQDAFDKRYEYCCDYDYLKGKWKK